MRILVTGGAGFLGTNIAIESLNRGHKVVAFDSFIRPLTEENLQVLKHWEVDIIRGDIRNLNDFERIPDVDAIIHTAANPGVPWSISSPMYDFEENALGTIHVLEFARSHGKIPVIYASTNKVYSELLNEVPSREGETRYSWDLRRIEADKKFDKTITRFGINELFPIDGFGKFPHSPYGVSKLAGDLYTQEYYQTYDVPTVINRMSCIYGLYQKGVEDQAWSDHFIRVLLKGDKKINIYGDGKQVRDMLWCEDVARLYVDELENINYVKGMVFNVGGGPNNTVSLLECIKILEKETGKTAELTFHPWRQADQRIYISDVSKIEQVLEWKPRTSVEEGLKRAIAQYV